MCVWGVCVPSPHLLTSRRRSRTCACTRMLTQPCTPHTHVRASLVGCRGGTTRPLPVPQVPSLPPGMAPLPPSGDAARARPGNAALWCEPPPHGAQHGSSASGHLFADLPPYAPQQPSIGSKRGRAGTRQGWPPTARGSLPLAHGEPLGSRAALGPRPPPCLRACGAAPQPLRGAPPNAPPCLVPPGSVACLPLPAAVVAEARARPRRSSRRACAWPRHVPLGSGLVRLLRLL